MAMGYVFFKTDFGERIPTDAGRSIWGAGNTKQK